jgi:hypothetical protein
MVMTADGSRIAVAMTRSPRRRPDYRSCDCWSDHRPALVALADELEEGTGPAPSIG